MKTLLAIALLLATNASSFCRVGESSAELIKRYGKPEFTEDQGDLIVQGFRFQGWVVAAYIVSGHSVLESYELPASSSTGIAAGGRLTQSQIDVVLGANSRGKQWKSVETVQLDGEERALGSWDRDHPWQLIRAWALDGAPLVAAYQRFVSDQQPVSEKILIISKEWNDSMAKNLQKRREEDIKKSGL